MKEQISLGRQIYIVFPLIDESAKLDYKNLIEGYDSISRDFPLPSIIPWLFVLWRINSYSRSFFKFNDFLIYIICTNRL